MLKETYWNSKGKHQATYEKLHKLIPVQGECPANRPKLELLRSAGNGYYDLFNNGLYNRAEEFRKAMGFGGGSKFAREGFNDEKFERRVEERLDVIIEEAHIEAIIFGDLKKVAVGDRMQVLADDVLGTPAAMATIRVVHSWGYTVHIDEDDDQWEGPVNFKGEVLCDMPG